MKKGKKNIYLLVILLVVIDIISKCIVTNILKGNTLIIIKNFLKFVFVKNTGAAFGILSGNVLILIIITLIFLYYIYKEIKNNYNTIALFSYSLILSGALGNLIDRIIRGYVVDFISFKIFGKEMAVFNIADSYITIGVILLLFVMIKESIYERCINR